MIVLLSDYCSDERVRFKFQIFYDSNNYQKLGRVAVLKNIG